MLNYKRVPSHVDLTPIFRLKWFSGAFQQTLRHVLLLGNALNGGDEVAAAQGFSLEVLGSSSGDGENLGFS